MRMKRKLEKQEEVDEPVQINFFKAKARKETQTDDDDDSYDEYGQELIETYTKSKGAANIKFLKSNLSHKKMQKKK